MVGFSKLAIGFSAIAVGLAVPTEGPVEKRGPFNFVFGPDHPLQIARRNDTELARRSNTNYNQHYTTGGTVNYNAQTNGFSVNWNTQNDFVVGVGWNPGGNAPITHTGSFSVNSGLGSLSVYGWTTNPLVEYYVIESQTGMGSGTFGQQKGSVSSDGGSYTIYENTRTNQPSIQGTSTFNQYISVRNGNRASGTVTVQNHFNAWASAGMHLGTMNFQVIAVESWSGSGSAQQSVSNTGGTTTGGGGGTTTTPASTGGGGGGCSAMWGQCGGIGWTGPTCCSSGSCKSSNPYYSQCL